MPQNLTERRCAEPAPSGVSVAPASPDVPTGRRRGVVVPRALARARLWPLLAALVAVGGLACAHAPPRGGAADPHRLRALYDAAIVDAAVVEPGEILPLRPLAADAGGRVAVVTLTDFAYAIGETQLTRDVWVTAVPEVQERCRRFSGDPAMRLRQLLGVRPDKPLVHFVVMSAAVRDVFRPALDPDPTTPGPCGDPAAAGCGVAFPAAVGAEHLQWVATQMVGSYVLAAPAAAPLGYPWTRLGYTYDWAPGAAEYGASEYVIRNGATVVVAEVVPYREYCAGPRRAAR